MQNEAVLASAVHVLAIEEVSQAPADAFTAAERAYADSKSDPERRLAARLAAKRAAGELLGVPIGELVSLSHGREHAAAAVLLLSPET